MTTRNSKPRTFNEAGALLGDDPLPEDLQSFVDEAGGAAANAGTPAAPLQLPTLTVTAQALPTFSLAQLLQPPYVYFLAGGLALLAYLWATRHD